LASIDIKAVKVGNKTNNAAFEPVGRAIKGVKIASAAIEVQEIGGGLI
jgi:hypothetical protein